jgi:hypothetical protein
MALRNAGMARKAPIALAVVLAALLVADCGSSGVHTQTPTSDPASSSTSTSPVPSTSSAASTATPSAIPTPSVTAPAQDAVNAYIAFYNLSTAADRDPAHADLAQLDKYLTGKAKSLFDGVYANMKSGGLAYRGTPDAPRLKVGSILSPSFLFLTSCPAASTSDPFVQYNVSTRKPVATTTPTVPPPWKRTISMQIVGGGWKVSDILVDSSRTCSA